MPQGFGKPQPNKIDKLIERAVRCFQKRQPEALDQIFDNLLNPHLNNQVVAGALAILDDDTDTKSWLCGYFASEINCTSDNDKPRHPIILLSKLLIVSGMEPFSDFMPYPGCRIMIINHEKFEALPPKVQALVQESFNVTESNWEEAQQINDALLEELMVEYS
ncbi:hypothetical protein [Rivularia sp. UHCC 0363]|uniref:hypothetical protein n=1 Tax=Rivularia sp. UHCC 0363 TaxID=3110244 RepID=UPI002B1F83F7|nr:hypothetical protein [Rivularia sp. UHCC 0363]MEA5595730.1 hypothetical protein [Rivularia sp. UHCC 0363]